MTAAALPSPVDERRTLADALVTRSWVTDAAIIGVVVLVTSVAAQISFRLPFTPVPITGQTFAVLGGAAVVGLARGIIAQVVYVALGVIGLPVFAGGASGLASLTGATGGYLVGFVVASALLGMLAERRSDRTVAQAIPAMIAGNVVIYICGVTWLAHSLHVSGTEALTLGMVPFVVGDLVKVVLAGAALPTAWRFVKG